MQQQARLSRMGKRLAKIKVLVGRDKRCRSLILTGAKPQGTWGHQSCGMAPAVVQQLRQDFSQAALARKPGGCTTTTWHLIFGEDSDPYIRMRVELLQSWMDALHGTDIDMQVIRRVWLKKYVLLRRVAGRWNRVSGIIGAVVATLLDLRWKPATPQ